MTMTLRHELDLMHDSYIDAVNSAVAAGDMSLADELGASYDDEAITLVAVRGEPHRPPAPEAAHP